MAPNYELIRVLNRIAECLGGAENQSGMSRNKVLNHEAQCQSGAEMQSGMLTFLIKVLYRLFMFRYIKN